MTHITKRSLPDQIYTVILRRIQNGELKPGERLNIEELSREFGISRTPLREAISRLSENGLVTVKHNSGPSVSELDPDRVSEIIEANSVMTNSIAGLIFKSSDTKALADKLYAAVDAQKTALAKGSSEDFFNASVAFHEEIIKACPNSVLAEMTMRTQVQLDAFVLSYLEWNNKKEESIRDHLAIAKAAEAGDYKLFCREMTAHNTTPLKFLSKRNQ